MMRKHGLLIGCAAGALLAALAAPAAAQSFQGEPTVVTGAAEVSTGPMTTNVLILTPETVINWAAEDIAASGAIDFQPVGTTATFESDSGLADYTVLNRILPVNGSGDPVIATVSFNGTVNSLIANNPGGHIWFYSPTGIIVGPTARFNVGSLLLTTNDIAFVPNPVGGFGSIYGPGGLVEFNGPAGSTGFVRIDPEAEISATGSNAYVGLVAPRVVQQGLVQADGQIAYVAAEQLEMTINGGLFDFVITVGTTDPEGIVHTGTTTGPASTSTADTQRIAMVALPKNDALTMMLSGAIGYAPAASVIDEGSSIVLSAGSTTALPSLTPDNRLGSIHIGNATFRNPLVADATNGIAIAPVAGTTTFEANAALYALGSIDVVVEDGEQVMAAGDLLLHAGEYGAGGSIGLQALGSGLIGVANRLQLNASSHASRYTDLAFLDATGGQIVVRADGGSMTALETFVDAQAFGAFGDAQGGLGTAGSIHLSVENGGRVATTDTISLDATGSGGDSDVLGGNGIGGTIALEDRGGLLDFGSVVVIAQGRGGAAAGTGGNGIGGAVDIAISGEAQNWGGLYVDAGAAGGGRYDPAGRTGGATALADAIDLTITGPGSLTVAADVGLFANSFVEADVAPGLTGDAGGIELTVADDGQLTVGGTLFAEASAFLIEESAGPVAASTPAQQGGTISIVADGGSINAAHLYSRTNAEGRAASVTAGAATGGTSQVVATNGGSIRLDDGTGSSQMIILAEGRGAPGPIAADAFGGTARIVTTDGSISVAGTINLGANGRVASFFEPPAPGDGFDATGGFATVDMTGGSLGTNSISASSLSISAMGDARFALAFGDEPPIVGNGGNGAGGTARLSLAGGTLAVDQLGIYSVGIGGASAASASATAFQSGSGAGGAASLVMGDGSATVTSLTVAADGFGGGGGPAATGTEVAAHAGDGRGGNAGIQLLGGSLTATDMVLFANGLGGNGMAHDGAGSGGDAGSAIGGSALLQSPAGWAGSLSAGFVSMQASGLAGNGGVSAGGANGAAGTGVAFSALVELADGAFAIGGMSISAHAEAADGEGTGGEARFTLIDSAGPVGARAIGDLYINASGFGPGGDTTTQSEAGIAALTVRPLDAASAIDLTGQLQITSLGSSAPAGAGIDVVLAGAPLTVGGQVLMSTSRDISIAGEPLLRGLGDVVLEARAIDATTPIAADLTLQATASGGDLAFGSVRSGLNLTLESTGGSLTATGDVVGAFASLTAGSDIAIGGDLNSVGTMVVNAGGSFTVDGAAFSDDANIFANGDITMTSLTSGEITRLEAANGNLLVEELQTSGRVTALGLNVDITSSGSLLFDDVLAFANQARIVTGGNMTASNVNGINGIDLDVGGTFTLFGQALGRTITVVSSDIAIDGAVVFGLHESTREITLVNRDSQARTYIGGAGRDDGYSLDRDEIALLTGDFAINILAASDIVIDDFALTFGLGNTNIGGGGRLHISSPLTVSVIGDVALTTSSADDTFEIDPSLIAVDTSTGSIALRGGNGAPLGRLVMIGNTVAVATTATLGQLATTTDFAAINALLDQPGGNPQPLRAGTMTFDAVDALYIQNSGPTALYDDRAGFAAGGIVINTTQPSTRIAINGQVLTPGGPLLGLDTQQAVTINGAPAAAGGRFDPASTINGCLIGASCGAAPPDNGPVFPPPPSDSDLFEPLPSETSPPALFGAPIIALADNDPLIEPPLVDEPITGIGNDDLWEPPCPGDGAEESCREAGSQP